MNDNERLKLLQQTFWFFSCWVGGFLIAGIFINVISMAMGVHNWNYVIDEIGKGNQLDKINAYKIINIVGHFCAHTMSSLVFGWLFFKQTFPKYFLLDKRPNILNIALTITALLSIFPLAIWIQYLNLHLIPESWVAEKTVLIQQKLMQMNSLNDLLLNLFLFGLIAGLGEELLFRGIMLRLFAQYSRNMHIAVWATALFFSLIHLQPEGFIPRFLLGGLLGYILVWTGNLWASIIGHICFNSMQVILFYTLIDIKKNPNIFDAPEIPLLYAILLAGLFIFACFMLWKRSKKREWTDDEYFKLL